MITAEIRNWRMSQRNGVKSVTGLIFNDQTKQFRDAEPFTIHTVRYVSEYQHHYIVKTYSYTYILHKIHARV